MNKNIKRVITKGLIPIVLIVIIIFGVNAYVFPEKKDISMVLCSENGEKINIELAISIQRYLLSPAEVKGTLTIDGRTYYSVYDTGTTKKGNFLEKLSQNMKTPWFVTSATDTQNNAAWILSTGKDFEKLCIVVKDTKTTYYYGPAETVEDVEKIILDLEK